jgi:glycosyltransferase involved in cell wall biosynthesis
MNKPRVAILMPTYEPNPVFLRQAIESVFAQTMTNWTLLIHDDLSAVNVKNLVRAYYHLKLSKDYKYLQMLLEWALPPPD